jgi:uncharacterized repeat protein (TIGR03803 family)
MRSNIVLTLTAAAVLCATGSSEAAVKEAALYPFTGSTDGGFPHGGVIADAKGNLFGVTTSDGAGHGGVVYELSPPKRSQGQTAWTQTTLYAFTGSSDGSLPQGALTMDSAGNLYGTTYAGGASGEGVVFELTKHRGAWKYHLLWTFTGGNDGSEPSGALTLDSAGNLYGTTTGGGTGVVGTVFELSPPTARHQAWTQNVLYNFTGNNDGGEPMGNVLLGADGNLYGTTAGYGQFNYGTVYRLTAPTDGGSWGFSTLHAFQGGADGEVPRDGLIQDSEGTLYGTTAGFDHSYGNVFQLNTDGSNYSVLYNVPAGQGFTGNGPWQTVSMDASGALYGTTYADGSSALGEVFKLEPPVGGSGAWTSSVVYVFQGAAAGQYPYSNVLIDKKGFLYGTAYGVAGQGGFFPGMVWRIKP